MESEEIKVLISELKNLKEIAFSDVVPNAPQISFIINKLNSIPKKDKSKFEDFALELKEEMFARNVNIKGLNINDFVSEKLVIIKNDESSQALENQVNIGFLELYNELITTIEEHFDVYKGYFILKLENNPQSSYKLLVLYDKSFIVEPIKKKIQSNVKVENSFKEIKDFIDDLTETDNSNTNYLCLLLLMPRINNIEAKEELLHNIKTLVNSFQYFENISLKRGTNENQNDYFRSIDKDDFFEELKYVNCTLLSNASINHEEEKIIKKLATNFKTPLVLYRTLKGGNSGSKVIEIRPKKELGEQYEKRYIIKYSVLNEERKIKVEKENFDEFIRGYKGFNDYECHHSKTLTHEGILYSYAINDLEKISYSYSEIIENSENSFYHSKVEKIDLLFNESPLYQVWSNIVDKKNIKISVLYSDYVNIEKILEQLKLILNKDNLEVQQDELVINFLKIWDHVIECNIKICHGDLHSDNFFIDNNGIYLIDFGYTGKKHSVIDHSSLECSIKFKHFPSYVLLSELTDLEEELALESSFQRSTRFTKTKRKELIELLELIKVIRNNAIRQPYTMSNLDYFISLFIMTFRQIRYKDMNQLYAYNSALILSRKLIQLLNIVE